MAAGEDRDLSQTPSPFAENAVADEEELQQYGVWVKAGPEDVDESEAEDDALGMSDISEDFDDELLGEDLFEEEPVAGNEEPVESDDESDDELDELVLEDVESELDDAINETPVAFDDEEALDLDIPDDTEELLTLEEDDLTIDMGASSEELGVVDTDATDLSDEDQEAADEVELDIEAEIEAEDLASNDDAEELGAADDQIGVPPHKSDESGIMDEDLNIEEELPDDLGDLTLDLSELDVDGFEETTAEAPQDVEEEPEELDIDALDTDLETADEPEPLEEPAVVEEIEELDESLEPDTLDTEEPEPAGEDELTLDELSSDDFGDELSLTSLSDEAGFDEITEDELVQSADEELPELQLDDDITDTSLDEADSEPEMDLESGFDDISAVEDEMSVEDDTELVDGPDILGLEDEPEELEQGAAADTQPTANSSDASVALLQDIESELHSIRSELTSLRDELSRLRQAEPAAAAPSAPAEPETEEDDGAGFFEDDGDETIALTGSELDNIMNTAEFTEEAGQPTQLDEQELAVAGLEVPEEPVDADDLVPDEIIPMDIDGPAPTVDSISLEAAEDEPEPLDLDIGESLESGEPIASDEHVKALAEMDIDAELSDIEDLDDLEEAEPPTREALAELAEVPEDDFSVEPELIDLVPEDSDAGTAATASTDDEATDALPDAMKTELKSVLSYMDQLLESLPEEKIQEFAESEHFDVYKRLFEELGLEQ